MFWRGFWHGVIALTVSLSAIEVAKIIEGVSC